MPPRGTAIVAADPISSPTRRTADSIISLRRRRPLVVALTLAIFLVACGDEEPAAETLQDLFVGGLDEEELMAQAALQQSEIEEAVAACMSAEGFEYIPRELDMLAPGMTERLELSEEEFREQYGYGITTIDHQASMVGGEDPNQRLVLEMDDATREAYELALWGEQPEFDPEEPQDASFRPEGCYGEAIEETQGDQIAVIEELEPAIMELQQQVEADPRMADAQAAWQRCMGEAGYDVSDRFEPQTQIFERLNELQQEALQAHDGEIDPFDGPPEVELDEDALAALQQDELDIAAAEGACSEEHLDPVEEEVRREHEGPFIEEHRELLEQIRPTS